MPNHLPLSTPSAPSSITVQPPAPIVNLALQGGGSHGAFTWGVLDVLLTDGRLRFEGISGTSAGAMNAVALAHGMAVAQGQPEAEMRESARASLQAFWDGVIDMGRLQNTLSTAQRVPFDLLFGGLFGFSGQHSPSQIFADALSGLWSQSLSPYQTNPLDINPLKDFLERQIDFDRVAAFSGLKVFVAATKVSSGKSEIFSGKRLTAKSVMASACLPTVFHAVQIEGEDYWDGGYCGNPALYPLMYECESPDVLLVQINPLRRNTLPTTAADILDRLNEITFNAALIAEMRAIDFVKRLLKQGKLDPAHYKDVRLHRIDGGTELDAYPASTKADTNGELLYQLRDLGRSAATRWLAQKLPLVGQYSSIDIAADYLNDVPGPLKSRTRR